MKAVEIFGKAKWLTTNGKSDTPYIRKDFVIDDEIENAEIVICGLGFFDLTLNGEAVSDDLFVPAPSDYHHIENNFDQNHCSVRFGEVLSHRIYVMKYDVTKFLKKENCIGIALGSGWYKNDLGDTFGWNFSHGEVKVCYKLTVEYKNGHKTEVLSDETSRWTQSPYVISRIRRGDIQDFNKYRLDGWNIYGYDDSDWSDLDITDAPDSEYYFQDFPADRVIRHITPKLINETEEGYIYDMGENIVGTPVIRTREPQVCEVRLSCSERLEKDNTPEEYTTHWQNSIFTTDESDRVYKLKFSLYAFRYAMVSKNAEIVDCEVIHTDIANTSYFNSDNDILNWYYDAYIRTQLDNIHGCIPSDCPHIERLGYTGDGELTCECGMMMFDSEKMYRKWIGDISDCQDTVSGHVQYTAPYSESGGGPGGWGCAIIEVPYQYYKMYGDIELFRSFIPKALKYFEYLDAHSENDLVVSDQPGVWCLGEWVTPDPVVIPPPFVNNYFYIKSVNRVLEYCRIVGDTELESRMEKLRERKIKAVIDNYYDETTGDFANNVQGANAFAFDLGLGDERTLENLVKHYSEYGMYDTGIFGTDILTRVLFDNGYEQLAFDLMTSKGLYSFNTWMTSGCTTIPEYWTFKRSQNHPMFGAAAKYLFTKLLGIVNEDTAFENVKIEPKFVDGMNFAEGYITTKKGRIYVKYNKTEESTKLEIHIPENTAAKLVCNGKIYDLEYGKTHFILTNQN